MKRETVVEQHTKDSGYYVIPTINKLVPYHGGHYTANKLLAESGQAYLLASELLIVSKEQAAIYFPSYVCVAVEREVTYIPKRSNSISLLTELQVACRAIAREF